MITNKEGLRMKLVMLLSLCTFVAQAMSGLQVGEKLPADKVAVSFKAGEEPVDDQIVAYVAAQDEYRLARVRFPLKESNTYSILVKNGDIFGARSESLAALFKVLDKSEAPTEKK